MVTFTPYFLKESLAEQVGEQQDGCHVRIFFTILYFNPPVYKPELNVRRRRCIANSSHVCSKHSV